MDNPNWAEILNAKAAVCAAITSGFTTLFAAAALIWARKAAKAAQDQVTLLQVQIKHSEPQPVILLTIRYEINAPAEPIVKIENLGEDRSFDVRVSSLKLFRLFPEQNSPSEWKFAPLTVLRERQEVTLKYSIDSPVPGSRFDAMGQHHPQAALFLDQLVKDAVQSTKTVVDKNSPLPIATMIVNYRNARGLDIQKQFVLMMYDLRTIQSEPETSLVI